VDQSFRAFDSQVEAAPQQPTGRTSCNSLRQARLTQPQDQAKPAASEHQLAFGINMAQATAAIPAAKLPATIGRFRPTRVLGRGGQGVVYLAYDPKLEREVAIKTLTRGKRTPDRLIAEARNVAKLDHPGIVPLYEIELTDDAPYLIYQFAEGQSLAALMENAEPGAIHQTVSLIVGVLDAIGYAHSQGILHRDLSPANVLVDSKGRPRILDFGVSTVVTADTQGNDMVGTANYMPPECIAKGSIGPHSDLYSIGVILHEMLTGRRLFAAESTMAVIYKILHEKVLPPSAFNPTIDKPLDEIVLRAIARDPAARYTSAEAMKEALEAYLRPAEEAAPANKQTGALDFLLRRMARKPDFPAVSALIAEINNKSGRPESDDVNELANVILKDYALTTKLLKLVNSAVYGQYGGTITTVSRAVLILGFDAIRTAALSIAIFEHLKSGTQADALKDAACGSFLSAMLAKDLGKMIAGVNAEEAFIGAMFHRLGRHLAIYYFPEEFEEIQTLVAQRGKPELAVAREVLGTGYAEFGIAVARQWNFPEKIQLAMTPPREGKVPAPSSGMQKGALLAAYANEIAENIAISGDDQDLELRLKRLGDRYDACLKIAAPHLREAVTRAVEATRNYAILLTVDVKTSNFFKRVVRRLSGDAMAEKMLSATPAMQVAGNSLAQTSEEASDDRRTVLVNAVTEITDALLEQIPVNQIFSMVLEAFYRGIDFTRVLLLLRDPKHHAMQARLGLGHDVSDVVPKFSFKLDDAPDIFNEAVRKGREFIVLDVNAAQYQGQIPGWCRAVTNPYSILLFPLMANKACIGLIYADKVGEQVLFSVQELKLLNTLIKQASLAFNQRR
jgi:serine/threonine protein kinase